MNSKRVFGFCCMALWCAVACGQARDVEIARAPHAAATTATVLLQASTTATGENRIPAAFPSDPRYDQTRRLMIERHIAGRDITHAGVLAAMERVPRHLFVPENVRRFAYEDGPLPIGHDQTISQPYIVAVMTQLLDPQPGDRILEVGTGSGYQAAILAELAQEVVTIEIVDPLARESAQRLREMGYGNVTVLSGDGYAGWPPRAPYDGVIVTAAPEKIPEPLLEQLKPGGRMVIPVGRQGEVQWLLLGRKAEDGSLKVESKLAVRFVPMTGAVNDQ